MRHHGRFLRILVSHPRSITSSTSSKKTAVTINTLVHSERVMVIPAWIFIKTMSFRIIANWQRTLYFSITSLPTAGTVLMVINGLLRRRRRTIRTGLDTTDAATRKTAMTRLLLQVQ